jgi:hypothetical protein
LQQCCRGGSFVNGYGSRNMFGAPDATPEVDFFFFLMWPKYFEKNNIFPLQWKTEGCKIFPQKKHTHKNVLLRREKKKMCLSGRLAATLFCVNSQWLEPTEFDEVHWRAHTSIQKRKRRKTHHGGVCHSVL